MTLFRPTVRNPEFVTLNESLDRQLGEITATVQSLRDSLTDLKTGFTAISRDQRASADDRKRQLQIVISRIEAIERLAATQHAANTDKLTALTTEITAMREPVAQFSAMRKRIISFGALALGAMGMLWTLAAPVYNYVVIHLFGS